MRVSLKSGQRPVLDSMWSRVARASRAIAVAAAWPSIAGAQVVRGSVTERETGAPVVGALISLDPAGTVGVSANPLRRVLSNARGEFMVILPQPGRFRLSIRRIGMRPWIDDLELPAGISRVTVVLDRISELLPVVTVRDSSLCVTRGRDAERISALWEAASTALATSIVSDADTVTGRRLVRIERLRLPYNMEIASENVHSYDATDGLDDVRFASASGDSLSLTGYWRNAGLNHMEFLAPDARALLSSAFLRDHCFTVAEGGRNRAEEVGLTFEPVKGRRRDIAGTLWLDARNFELRNLEFHWLDLPPTMRHERIGGDIQFVRLPDGTWLVHRWALRMPRPGSVMTNRPTGMGQRDVTPDTLVEQGGLIVLHGLGDNGPPGLVTGEIKRPDRKPLRWARVRIVGTTHLATVDSAGRFAFDSVTPGFHAIVVEHPEYDAAGLRVAEREFVLDPGSERNFDFVAPTEREIGDRLCPNRNWRWPTLRVTLINELTSAPVVDTDLRLHWQTLIYEARQNLAPVPVIREAHRNARTALDGVAVFCSIEPGKKLTLSLLESESRLRPLASLSLGLQENRATTIRVSPR